MGDRSSRGRIIAGVPLLADLLDVRESFSGGTSAVAQARQQTGRTGRAPGTGGVRRTYGGAFDETKHRRAPAGGAGGGRFIASGSSGEMVRTVQQRVGAKSDGKFGQHTQAAVRRFQKRHGLKVDGVVGRQTALALAGHYSEAKKTKPGALDRGSLKRLKSVRKGGSSLRARTRRRSSGGIVV